MPRYLISFDAHAMDHITAEDLPAVTDASRRFATRPVSNSVWSERLPSWYTLKITGS